MENFLESIVISDSLLYLKVSLLKIEWKLDMHYQASFGLHCKEIGWHNYLFKGNYQIYIGFALGGIIYFFGELSSKLHRNISLAVEGVKSWGIAHFSRCTHSINPLIFSLTTSLLLSTVFSNFKNRNALV